MVCYSDFGYAFADVRSFDYGTTFVACPWNCWADLPVNLQLLPATAQGSIEKHRWNAMAIDTSLYNQKSGLLPVTGFLHVRSVFRPSMDDVLYV